MTKRTTIESTADAYLELLAARGVEYFFANAGTDFAPIIEAYAKRTAQGQAVPRPITVPHEITAMGMAHGFAMITGRPQAVMVHVIVGTANALGGLINAARANVPILFTAGRTPLTEAGFPGSRDLQIHWAQESFDQGGLVREFVKWDYELRNLAQLETVVDRALTLSQAEPQGPVYLMLPREVLGERHESFEYSEVSRVTAPRPTLPDAAALTDAAQRLARAKNPIIITKAVGRDPQAVLELVSFAETLGAPVFDPHRTHMNFPQDHPLHGGFDIVPYLEEADALVVIESDAPWFPQIKRPRPETSVIQIGVDPLFSRYPIRGFAADLTLAGTPRLTLRGLRDALAPLADARTVAERQRRWESHHAQVRESAAARARAVQADVPIDMTWVSRCVGDLLDSETIVVNEYDLDGSQACLRHPGTYFGAPASGGLGWGLGAALGAKLASGDKTVICCVGDGSYIFGCPTAAHFVARAYDLPVLFVVFNNRAWNAVKRAVRSFAGDGWAARAGSMVLSDLDPAPDYDLICRASGGHGERVDDPSKLPDALSRALRVVREEKRQALLNVICKKP